MKCSYVHFPPWQECRPGPVGIRRWLQCNKVPKTLPATIISPAADCRRCGPRLTLPLRALLLENFSSFSDLEPGLSVEGFLGDCYYPGDAYNGFSEPEFPAEVVALGSFIALRAPAMG